MATQEDKALEGRLSRAALDSSEKEQFVENTETLQNNDTSIKLASPSSKPDPTQVWKSAEENTLGKDKTADAGKMTVFLQKKINTLTKYAPESYEIARSLTPPSSSFKTPVYHIPEIDRGLSSEGMALSLWPRYAAHFFPNFHNTTYFIPSRPRTGQLTVSHDDKNTAEQRKRQYLLECMQRKREYLLECLLKLNQNTRYGMMVVSELNFRKNIDNEHNPVRAASNILLPTVAKTRTENHDGFPILVIHRKYGLLLGQVQFLAPNVENTEEIDKKLRFAVSLLDGMEITVRAFPYEINVRKKSIILPDVHEDVLRNTLDKDTALKKLVEKCIRADPMEGCLCLGLTDDVQIQNSDQFFVPAGVQQWWSRVWAGGDSVPSKDEQAQHHDFELLLATFCGASTLIEVEPGTAATRAARYGDRSVAETCRRTDHWSGKSDADNSDTVVQNEGQPSSIAAPGLSDKSSDAEGKQIPSAAPGNTNKRNAGEPIPDADTGTSVNESKDTTIMADEKTPMLLSPDQIELVDELPELAFLTGPPGTGKSKTLQIVGKIWMNACNDIHIISTTERSRAISFLLKEQLELAAKTIEAVSSKSPTVHLHHVYLEEDDRDDLVDELERIRNNSGSLHVIMDEAGPDYGDWFKYFCEDLLERVPDVHLWASALESHHRPKPLREVILAFPHRCPPQVLREVEKAHVFSEHVHGQVYGYSYIDSSLATSDENHDVIVLNHYGEVGHSNGYARDCERCGVNLATRLLRLNVGEPGEKNPKFRDVFILTILRYKDDSEVGLVRGLRKNGFPVQVMKRHCPQDIIRDVALARSDKVTVADFNMAAGLERRIVVGMGNKGPLTYSKLLVTSRCSSKLIWIDSGT